MGGPCRFSGREPGNSLFGFTLCFSHPFTVAFSCLVSLFAVVNCVWTSSADYSYSQVFFMENSFSLHTTRTPLVLYCCAVFLCANSLLLQILKFKFGLVLQPYHEWFDVSLERNLPTYFSTVLILINACILLVIAWLNSAGKYPAVDKWGILAAGFILMACDECAHLHEPLVAIIRPHLWHGRLYIFYYSWVIPYLVVVVAAFFYFLRFLLQLPQRSRVLFFLAGAVYICGCIGMEMIGAVYDELWGTATLKYNFISTIEEGMEMTGQILFLYGLLDYLAGSFGQFIIKIEK